MSDNLFEILSKNPKCCFSHPFFRQLDGLLLFEDYILWYFYDLKILFSSLGILIYCCWQRCKKLQKPTPAAQIVQDGNRHVEVKYALPQKAQASTS